VSGSIGSNNSMSDRVKLISQRYNTTESHVYRLLYCGASIGYTITDVLRKLEESTESYVAFSNEVMERYEEIFGDD